MSNFIKLPLFITLIFIISFGRVHAQLCQGSLGDPIVNITFGAGSNPGAPLAAATTNYQYSSADCPADGFYTVRNSTTACFGDTWHTINADHTGNAGGYFMLVNASVQPSAFYLQTVNGLCGNTTYEFAAWVMNVLRSSACSGSGIQPNLTFSIEKTDGTLLKSYNTNNIPSQAGASWQQFGFFFTTPSSVSDVVLRIVNNSSGGCGNDLALDDITFRACGPKLIPTVAGGVNPTIVTACEGTAASYTFNCSVSAGFVNPLFQWQNSINGSAWADMPGENNTTLIQNVLTTTAPGTYKYRLAAAEAGNMASAQCRVLSDELTIFVSQLPVTTAASNTPVCAGNQLLLRATGGTQYQWTGVNGFSATGENVQVNNAQQLQAGKYYVEVTSSAGCKKLDSTIVVVNTKPVATTSFDEITICKGNSIQLAAAGGDTYQWIPATGLSAADIADPIAAPSATTAYQVVAYNQFACTDTALVTVQVSEKPTADAGPDKYILDVPFVQLTGKATGTDFNLIWDPPVYIDNTGILEPTVNPPNDTSYVLRVESNVGCGIATDTVKVYVFKDIFVPTAFTPNGDGLNDTWRIPGLNAFTEYEISVFNRGGQLVFYTKDTPLAWNGQFKGEPLPSGAYVYMIDLKKKRPLLKGTIMLIR